MKISVLFVEHNSLGTLVQGSAATGQPSIELPMVNESAKCIFVLDHLCKINSNGLDTCFIIINFVSNIFFSLFDSLLHFFSCLKIAYLLIISSKSYCFHTSEAINSQHYVFIEINFYKVGYYYYHYSCNL